VLLWQAARNEAQKISAYNPIRDKGLEDLKSIAARLGARVEVHSLQPEVSGVIHKPTADSEPLITINADEPMARQRFTLAHEIGHLVERMIAHDDDWSFIDFRSADRYDLHEFFADEFAGELLMPAGEFTQRVNELGEYGAAAHFNVSVPAILKRKTRLEKNPAA
jgi:Zn-dependent peptidase ImmA (M78 family)